MKLILCAAHWNAILPPAFLMAVRYSWTSGMMSAARRASGASWMARRIMSFSPFFTPLYSGLPRTYAFFQCRLSHPFVRIWPPCAKGAGQWAIALLLKR